MNYRVYTDGSCYPNPGPSAYAAIIVGPNNQIARRTSGYLGIGTNNQAEFEAILHGLKSLPDDAETVTVLTDSQYCMNCVTRWHHGWDKRGWYTKSGQPVKNSDLIQAIVDEVNILRFEGVKVEFQWVRGHNENQFNEMADRLAKETRISQP